MEDSRWCAKHGFAHANDAQRAARLDRDSGGRGQSNESRNGAPSRTQPQFRSCSGVPVQRYGDGGLRPTSTRQVTNCQEKPWPRPVGSRRGRQHLRAIRRVRRLCAVAKSSRHQTGIPTPVRNRDDPERLFVWRIGDEVFISRDMESQRSSSQVRTSMSDVW